MIKCNLSKEKRAKEKKGRENGELENCYDMNENKKFKYMKGKGKEELKGNKWRKK